MVEIAHVSVKKPEAKRENKTSQKQQMGQSQSISSPVDQILFLQRTIGNQAVGRLIKSGALQAKLMIGQPGDIYEQEADRMAEQVMRMPEPQVSDETKVSNPARNNSIQRKCPGCNKGTKIVKEEEEEKLQKTEASGSTPEVTPELESSISAVRGGGQPLPESVRAFYEPRFGQDFSQVRLHTDAKAAEAARAVNARAFTVGSDVVFGQGEYVPDTSEGRRLMGHELTHVIQQSKMPHAAVMRVPSKGGVTETPSRYSYSTNCGWIDWGHTIPNHARDLIARVREASMRLKRTETKLAADAPALTKTDKCPKGYGSTEVADSMSEPPITKIITHPAGTIEVHLGGFGVNSSDSTKFNSMVTRYAKIHTGSMLFKNQYSVEISGFTDCVGSRRENISLRVERAIKILMQLINAGENNVKVVKRDTAEYLESNASREGRRWNRGVMIRFVPIIQPERLNTPPMESGKWGIVVNRATVRAELNRSLSEDEVLMVALSIFARQSAAFEALQITTDLIAQSSFSEEDLPSNLISFYRAARGFSREEVAKICDGWDQTKSLNKLKAYKFHQNRTFYPPNLPPGGKWPAEFSTIKTIQPGSGDLYEILEILLEGPVNSIRGCYRGGKQIKCK